MQTLGLSGSTPASENRLKSLFWPSVQTGADVDYLGTQGYWICAFVAVFTGVVCFLIGHPIVGVFGLLYYYLGGVGVREHSLFAAAAVFILFAIGTVASPGVLGVILTAVLLSNLRATWIASNWKPDSEQAAMPIRLSVTWGDKFSDILPRWLWPKARIPYYVFSVGYLMNVLLGLATIASRRHH